jgi:hypothetical protein
MQRKVELKIRTEREMPDNIIIPECLKCYPNNPAGGCIHVDFTFSSPGTNAPVRERDVTELNEEESCLPIDCAPIKGEDQNIESLVPEHPKTNRISTVISYVAAFSAIAITMSLSCPKYFERLASCVSSHYIDATLLTPALITMSSLAILCLAQYANTPKKSQGDSAILYNQ